MLFPMFIRQFQIENLGLRLSSEPFDLISYVYDITLHLFLLFVCRVETMVLETMGLLLLLNLLC